ncbi:hypothetical protein BCR39DRAFT_511725 [Naematelia encephala]|uniref:GATA-type domain-containing protein n=1 Tax=Naematelia encephala TaxID=71784 RepID=A0A1Y2BMA4_9TREE|nr:hypothetical protein BCR39DRAFT_511725 [Naematelia encephala]
MSLPSISSSSIPSIPRVGGVRCYWALLTPQYPSDQQNGHGNGNGNGNGNAKPELGFVHPDPVLAVHLGKQAVSFIGRGVLEFIHPAEREQARRDLMNAIAADDLQGSVTRIRFARLSRIRSILGAPQGEIEYPYDAAAYVEDDEYLIIDLVLNWVSDGILLAFFHAIRDKDPVANNDPTRSHEEWSNYCGTANMGEDQIDALHRHISALIPVPPKSRFPPTRIFQLHTTATSPTRPNSLVFSWPPPRPPGSQDRFDGLYDADEYSDLMRGVDMDPSQLAAGSDEIRTNCTTRFGAKHSITSEGLYRHITSVFIPYGSLIFSCFQTTKQIEFAPREPQQRQAQNAQQMYGLMTPQQDWSAQNTVTPAQDWRADDRVFGYDERIHAAGFQAQPQTHLAQSQQQQQRSHPVQAYPTPSPGGPYPDSFALQMDNSPPLQNGILGAGSGGGGANSRPMVRPPGNIECCQKCGTRESPEWRRSENGSKDLCNACGLKLAREVAKREGRQKPRKKKIGDVR